MKTSNTFRNSLSAIVLGLSMTVTSSASAGWFFWGTPEVDSETAQETSLIEKIGQLAGIAGLRFETDSMSGVTDQDGNFDYVEGEDVRFYLGNTLIGEVKAKEVVSALDFLSAGDHPDKLQNLLRVLDTLDADDNAENGVEITDAADQYMSQFTLPLNKPAVLFEGSQVVTGLVNAFTNNTGLNGAVDAFVSFRETLLNTRRNTDEEIILSLMNTKWDAELKSTACSDQTQTANLVYNFNIFGILTYGQHNLTQTVTDSGIDCKATHSGFYFNTYETDNLYTCANKCTASDLNRVIIEDDAFGEIVTTISYNQEESTIQVHTSYFDEAGSQTETLVLTKR